MTASIVKPTPADLYKSPDPKDTLTNEGIPATQSHDVLGRPGVSDGKGNIPLYTAPPPPLLVRETEPTGPVAYVAPNPHDKQVPIESKPQAE